jgi:hypothetical protein
VVLLFDKELITEEFCKVLCDVTPTVHVRFFLLSQPGSLILRVQKGEEPPAEN